MPAKDVKYLKKILEMYGFHTVGTPRYSTRSGVFFIEETFHCTASGDDKAAFSLTYEENNAKSLAESLAACVSRDRALLAMYKTSDESRKDVVNQMDAASDAVTAACEGRPFLVPNKEI